MIIKIHMIYERYVRVGGLPLETACNSPSESVEHVKDIPDNDCWETSPVSGKGYVRAVSIFTVLFEAIIQVLFVSSLAILPQHAKRAFNIYRESSLLADAPNKDIVSHCN